MKDLKPNEQRAKTVIVFIGIVLLLELVSLVSGYLQYVLLQKAANGEFISEEMANANDSREFLISIIYLITYIISGITFILWFRRAYFNLHQKVNHLTYTEGWAAGAWFVPILNLFRPFQIMKELYNETKELFTKKGIETYENFSSSPVLWWWIFWLLNAFIGQFINRLTMNAETIDELIASTIAGMIGNIVGIPLALITIKVIKNYSNIEPLLNDIKDDEETITSAIV